MGRIILLMDLDSFFASAEEVRRPEIRGKPVVVCVYSGRTADSGAVSTSNYKARELGIKSGMPIAFAKKFARGHEVVFLPVDKDYYSEVSDRVMSILSPEADAMEQVSVDEAYLDVTKRTNGNWDNAAEIAQRIKKRVEEQEKITCSIGVGPNKFIAKMAAGISKPDGLTVVKEDDVKDFLKNIPAAKLHGVGPKTTEALSEVGVETTEQLAAYELTQLKKIFGESRARYLHEISHGIDDSPVEEKESTQLSRMGTLPEDTRDAEIIYLKILELSADLAGRVKEMKIGFRTVSIIAVDTDLQMHSKSETIQVTGDLLAALPTARKLLETFLKDNPGIVLRRVGIRASNFTEDGGQKTLGEF
jgi:DNA polymerase IV (DinB-like DNA polymerase)